MKDHVLGTVIQSEVGLVKKNRRTSSLLQVKYTMTAQHAALPEGLSIALTASVNPQATSSQII